MMHLSDLSHRLTYHRNILQKLFNDADVTVEPNVFKAFGQFMAEAKCTPPKN